MEKSPYLRIEALNDQPPAQNQRPPAELGVLGRPLEGAGATLCWWSLICPAFEAGILSSFACLGPQAFGNGFKIPSNQ